MQAQELGEDTVEVPALRALHQYWLGCRRGGRLPSRAEIDPVDIPDLLRHVMLVDVDEGGARFRFRLVGTKVATGKDPTGCFLHEAAPKGLYGHHICALYVRAVREARPFYTVFDYRYAEQHGRGPERIHRLFLPLSDDGTMVNMLLVGQTTSSNRWIQGSAWEHPPITIRERALRVLDPPAVEAAS